MIDILIPSCVLLNLCGLWLLRRSTGNLFLITPSHLFYFLFSIMIILGAYGLYFGFGQHMLSTQPLDQHILDKLLLLVAISSILIPTGIYCASLLLRKSIQAVTQEFYSQPFENKFPQGAFTLVFLLTVGVFIFYLARLPQIPLLELITNPSIDVALLRSQATNAFVGKYHRFTMFSHELLPFLGYMAFSASLCVKRYRPLFLIVLAVTFFVLLADLQKSPVINFIFGLVLTYIISTGVKISWRRLALFGVVMLALATLVKAFAMKMTDRSFDFILTATLERIAGGQIAPLYFYLLLFPAMTPFLGGTSFPNPAGIFPFNNVPLPVLIQEQMMPDLFTSGVVGSAPTIFFGSVYANFGTLAACFSMLSVGVLLGLSDRWTMGSLRRDPIGIAFLVWLSQHLATLVGTGIEFILVDVRIVYDFFSK